MVRGRGSSRVLALAVATLVPLAAHADFKEWTVSAWPAYAVTYVDSRAPSGAGGGLEVGFGVTESLTLKASGFLSWHPVDDDQARPQPAPSASSRAMVGINYSLDVIRLVPSFDLNVGLLGLRGDAGFQRHAEGQCRGRVVDGVRRRPSASTSTIC